MQIKKVNKGEYVGYGAIYKAKNDILIAVLPVGYNEGIGRENNNRYVYINNNKYDVIGEIGMNMIVVKIDEMVNITDKVELMGENITLGQISRFANKSIHEMLLNIGKNNERIYIKNNTIEFISKK